MRHFKRHLKSTLVVISLGACLGGCASTDGPKMESVSVAKRLGMPRCRVSVPMSPDEVLLSARQEGDPHPEARDEWAKMVAAIQPGDQLRAVSCPKDYFYVLFRGESIVAKMHTMIYD